MVIESVRPVAVGRPGRRRRRLGVISGVLVAVVLVGAVGWFEGVPRYRPGLQAGERYGIDVSNHQGEIDWPAVAGDDVTYAYIKATEGDDFVDKSFARNWSGADSAGIARGAYHFFTLCSSGAAQAANFLKALPAGAKALPPAVDLEFSTCPRRPDVATFQRDLRTFIDTVEAKVGQEVVVYAMPSFTRTYPIGDVVPARDRWVRRLFRRPAESGWAVWQLSDRGRVAGIDEPVDVDIWR